MFVEDVEESCIDFRVRHFTAARLPPVKFLFAYAR